MIVAWQFTARDLPTKRIRPVGCGMIWVRSFALIILVIEQRMDCKRGRPSLRARKSHRTLRDGSFVLRIPGNKLPSYDRSVPTEQSPNGGSGGRILPSFPACPT
jgi:hypothetical protein